MTNEKETSCIINIYNKRYFTFHSKPNWDDKVVVETVAEVITKKFGNYMKEQEGLERMGKTEQDFMIPPGGLNR